MGRVNKMIEGVFVDIVGGGSELSAYDMFITNNMDKKDSKGLKEFLNEYRSVINGSKGHFERLAILEELIMQLRSRENVDDIKLSLVREYIYARCSFYRKNKKSKDIRVIVDNIGEWIPDLDSTKLNDEEYMAKNKDKISTSLNKLLSDKKFLDRAKEKLMIAMDKEIADGITNYKEMYNAK